MHTQAHGARTHAVARGPTRLPRTGSVLGLSHDVVELIESGKGVYRRYAESGAVLVDRSRHLDMLEWAWWLNAMGDDLTYK